MHVIKVENKQETVQKGKLYDCDTSLMIVGQSYMIMDVVVYSLLYSGHYAVVLNSLTKTLSILAKDPFKYKNTIDKNISR